MRFLRPLLALGGLGAKSFGFGRLGLGFGWHAVTAT
jgi:hypothetical protein